MSLDDVAAKFRKLAGAAERTERLLAALLEIETVADMAAVEL